MVCSTHGDQLSTVLVLLYATSQQHPPNPTPLPRALGDAVSRLAGRINCCVELRSQRHVPLHRRTLAPYVQCLNMTVPHQDTNREAFRSPLPDLLQKFLANKEWNPMDGPHTSRPFTDFPCIYSSVQRNSRLKKSNKMKRVCRYLL